MIKVHYQDDQEDLIRIAEGQMTTLVEEGVKSASSCAFPPEKLSEFAPDNDHFLLHVVAMGDHETYGPNKNADTFSKAANQKYHPTFVSHGHFYREHRNRDPKTQGIGHIKASAYNEDMHRIELLVHGHKKKAEEEYQMAKEGKVLSTSMSCRVPWDRCNICNKKAASRAEYCDHMKHGALKYHQEFEKYAFVFNDEPTFFDISRVRNPADRIAHYLEYRFPGEKAASHDQPILGVDWAEFEGVSESGPAVSGMKLQVLTKLAEEESWSKKAGDDPSPKMEFFKAATQGWQDELTDPELDALRTMDSGTMFRKLARAKVMLPFGTFCAYVKNASVSNIYEDSTVKQACGCLGDVFQTMFKSPTSSGMSDLCDAGSDLVTSFHGGGRDDLVERVMNSVTDRFSLEEQPVKKRVIIMTMKKASVKNFEVPKEASTEAEGLALAYGHYKVSALTDMLKYTQLNESDYLNAVAQNKIYD